MAAPAEMPHADEALKSLVARFREDPGSSAFTELAAALLARGHASEALRIAEHGLQLQPDSVDGRIERAASLLALGRPRVAFVELKRALAIDPTNRRAMRLLGKTYVDAGAPSRAAELLKQRFQPEETETTHVTQAPNVSASALATDLDDSPVATQPGTQPSPMIPREDTAPLPRRAQPEAAKAAPFGGHTPGSFGALPQKPAPAPAPRPAAPSAVAHSSTVGPIPALFSDLTRDLGLGDAVPETAQSRVEVTQIIRRKKERTPRSPSELAGIDGPIVDTTQPGQITEVSGDLESAGGSLEPPPLFDLPHTAPRLQLAPAFGLDDEPLFQEHMPFAVRPVDGGNTEAPSDMRDTVDEDVPPELDRALRAALGGPSPRGANLGDTQVDEVEESRTAPEAIGIATAPALDRVADTAPSADGVRFDGGRPFLEVSRPSRRAGAAPRLELVEPKPKPRDVALAALGAVLMVVCLVAFYFARPPAWQSDRGAVGHEAPVSSGSNARGGGSLAEGAAR